MKPPIKEMDTVLKWIDTEFSQCEEFLWDCWQCRVMRLVDDLNSFKIEIEDLENWKLNNVCKCGSPLTRYDKGNGEKFIGCYGCQKPEEKCDCQPNCQV